MFVAFAIGLALFAIVMIATEKKKRNPRRYNRNDDSSSPMPDTTYWAHNNDLHTPGYVDSNGDGHNDFSAPVSDTSSDWGDSSGDSSSDSGSSGGDSD